MISILPADGPDDEERDGFEGFPSGHGSSLLNVPPLEENASTSASSFTQMLSAGSPQPVEEAPLTRPPPGNQRSRSRTRPSDEVQPRPRSPSGRAMLNFMTPTRSGSSSRNSRNSGEGHSDQGPKNMDRLQTGSTSLNGFRSIRISGSRRGLMGRSGRSLSTMSYQLTIQGEKSVRLYSRTRSFMSIPSLREEAVHNTARTRRFILAETNPGRRIYELLLALVLLYTGTVFPYRLCFLDFNIPHPIESHEGWGIFERIVDSFFIFDLLIGFIFTFRDRSGVEIFAPGRIVKNYLRGQFWINAVACIPDEFMQLILDFQSGSFGRTARITRVQRLQRLVRLTRLLRLVKVAPIIARHFRLSRLQTQMSLLCILIYLLWAVHLMACFWYLSAYFHTNENGTNAWETWVGRREPHGDKSTFLTEPPFVRWLHSMYFIMAVFTTVGFGEIAAFTIGEIVIACLAMLIGTVVISSITSEMLNEINRSDLQHMNTLKTRELVKAFTDHTGINEEARDLLINAIEISHKSRPNYERQDLCKLFVDGVLPQWLVDDLAQTVYNTKLINNRFVTSCSVAATVQGPSHFVMHLAIMLVPQYYESKEMVYRCHEHPQQLGIVQAGAFAAVAFPSRNGGIPEPNPFEIRAVAGICRILEDSHHARRKSMDSLDAEEADEAFAASQHHMSVKKAATKGGLFSSTAITWPAWITSSFSPEPAASSQLTADKEGTGSVSTTLKDVLNLRNVNGNDRRARRLWPYKFFCHGNYFGESELFANCPRTCTVRCESPEGLVLELQKSEFLELAEAFPEYAAIWRAKAARREATRTNLLLRLRRGAPFRVLAASLIQERWRDLQYERARHAAGMPSALRTDGNPAIRVTMVFLPGRLGILVDKEMGLVTAVEEDSQASRAGVRVGWCMRLVDGERFSLPQLDRCLAGMVDYEVIFDCDTQLSPTVSNRMETIGSRGSSDYRGDRPPRWNRPSQEAGAETVKSALAKPLAYNNGGAAAAASAVAAAAASTPAGKTVSSNDIVLFHANGHRRQPEVELALPVPDPEDKFRGATKTELRELREAIYAKQSSLEADVSSVHGEITNVHRKVMMLLRDKQPEISAASNNYLLNL